MSPREYDFIVIKNELAEGENIAKEVIIKKIIFHIYYGRRES